MTKMVKYNIILIQIIMIKNILFYKRCVILQLFILMIFYMSESPFSGFSHIFYILTTFLNSLY